ncbi:hypothetical protein, conserved [Eimeria tenella]|uniref:Uncharacterized protein n=1 Tax=Eimeria tenella TaxID=5802 RepID=U6L2L6_EIMTE|nr:hypothetical protein, conserved [Eimeria tenella]CDJ42864.1 hypothetical protein, conserved [Eimeria tenella]|eukprot:XP_013233614.1 hypothetical protein, conserved [Eimeria tenella]
MAMPWQIPRGRSTQWGKATENSLLFLRYRRTQQGTSRTYLQIQLVEAGYKYLQGMILDLHSQRGSISQLDTQALPEDT